MSSVEEISGHVGQAKQTLEESATQTQTAASSVETSNVGLQAAVQSCEQMAESLMGQSLEGKAGEVNALKERIMELSATVTGRREALEQQIGELAGLQGQLDEVIAQAEALRGLNTVPGAGSTASRPAQSAMADSGSAASTSGYRATVGYTNSFNYKKTFFTANPSQEGKVVVHHAVEQQIKKRYEKLFSDNEIHSLENLRGIPKGNVNNKVHLSAIRKAWNRFYRNNPNPTRKRVLDFATEVDLKYGDQFDPPLDTQEP